MGGRSDGVGGAATAGVRPLAGVRVLDLTRILAGPFCTMLLGDLGAEVVKVEAPAGDETRRWGPPFIDGTASYYYAANRNKRSIVLDLRSPDDREVFDAVVRQSDVVIHNFTAGVARRLAVERRDIERLNPDCIYANISGFGIAEPDRKGFDLNVQALSGLMSVTGEPAGPAYKVGIAISDLAAGLFAMIGILGALYEREANPDRGSAEIEVTLIDALTALLSNQAMNWLLCGQRPTALGNDHPTVAPYGVYTVSDGQVSIAAVSDVHFQELCDSLGASELAADDRFATNGARIGNRAALDALLAPLVREQTMAQLEARLTERGVPCAPVVDVPAALDRAEHLIASVAHPDLGRLAQVMSPIRYRGEYFQPYLAPPRLGEHSGEIRAEMQRETGRATWPQR